MQSRLCAVLKYLVDQTGSKSEAPPVDPDHPGRLNIPLAVLQTQHTPVIERNGAHCVVCWTGSGPGTRQLYRWLSTSSSPVHCRADVQASSRYFVKLPGSLLINFKGRLLHATHDLCMYRGMVFCAACGFYAGVHAKKLCQPCRVGFEGLPRTAQGEACLRRLEAGRTQHPTVLYWPK